ncbi:MAG: Hsp20/alpha crystallin family protein [Bacteroidota bacterium]
MSNDSKPDEVFRNIRDGFSEFGKKVSTFFDDTFSAEEGDGGIKSRSDVYSYQGEYLVELELPGVKKEDVQIQIYEGTLTIKGTKYPPEYASEAKYDRQNRSYGSFLRTFELPVDVELEKVKAKFDAGVLTVRLQRPSAAPAEDGKAVDIE